MQPQTPKGIMRSLSVIYWGLFLSLFIFISVSAWLDTQSPVSEDAYSVYLIKTILVFLLIVLAPTSYLWPQKLIQRIDKQLPLDQKLTLYRSAQTIRFAAMNSAGVFIAIGFMLTGETNLMYMQVIVLLFFIIYKPSPFKTASDLELDENEKREIMPS